MSLRIFWQPDGINLDQLGDKRLTDISDGDTPKIEMSIRMLSIDTPETGPVARGMSKAEALELAAPTADWIESGRSPVTEALAEHLLPRLRRDRMAQVHWDQGAEAKAHFKAITAARLARPSGRARPLFLRAADERFDGYGRLLAYVAPSYSAEERRQMTRRERATFNFDMIASGHAASFIIYPAIPGEIDLPMTVEAARTAQQEGKGAWADPLCLTGYEYRMVEKLMLVFQKVAQGVDVAPATWSGWIERYCVDVSTGLLYRPQDYVRVAPWNRLFLWRKDVRAAVRDLGLAPAPT